MLARSVWWLLRVCRRQAAKASHPQSQKAPAHGMSGAFFI
jgi:hypothetical protein